MDPDAPELIQICSEGIDILDFALKMHARIELHTFTVLYCKVDGICLTRRQTPPPAVSLG